MNDNEFFPVRARADDTIQFARCAARCFAVRRLERFRILPSEILQIFRYQYGGLGGVGGGQNPAVFDILQCGVRGTTEYDVRIETERTELHHPDEAGNRLFHQILGVILPEKHFAVCVEEPNLVSFLYANFPILLVRIMPTPATSTC